MSILRGPIFSLTPLTLFLDVLYVSFVDTRRLSYGPMPVTIYNSIFVYKFARADDKKMGGSVNDLAL